MNRHGDYSSWRKGKESGQTHLVNKTALISITPFKIALIVAYCESVWLEFTLPDKQVER